jgi:uncharacterized protein (TIGR03067 family)
MKAQTLAALIAFLLIAAAAPDDEAKKERVKLKGTWSVVSAETNGEKVPDLETKDIKMVFDGDKFIPKKGEQGKPATFVLDPTKKPKTIDIIIPEGNEQGQAMQGIYELNGDDLKLCFNRPGKERPTEFAGKAKETVLMLLKRDKP